MVNKYQLHCRIAPDDFNEDWALFFESNYLVPEIYLRKHDLRSKSPDSFAKIEEWIRKSDFKPTLHAPLINDDPILFDAIAKKESFRLADQIIDLAGRFNPQIIVCHPIFEKYRLGEKMYLKWIDDNLSFFDRLLKGVKSLNTIISVENIFEEKPNFLQDLFKGLSAERFMFCFDIGHFNRYSKVNLTTWFDMLGYKICELHVHDNYGKHDDHLPAGEGNFPFKKLMKLLNNINKKIVLTIEPLTKSDAKRAVVGTRKIFEIT
jgi:sugar phosphate isomerase/epimerase